MALKERGRSQMLKYCGKTVDGAAKITASVNTPLNFGQQNREDRTEVTR
jgi:hypothetical protein